MRTAVQILAFLISAVGVVFCACPTGWQPYYNNCLIVMNESKSWFEASKDCSLRYRGGHLFYMDSSSHHYKYFYYKASNWFNLTESEVYYLGAERNASGWFWGNGKELSLRIRNWLQTYSSQGNHLVLQCSSRYDDRLGSYGFKFKAVDGQSKHKYICAIEEKRVNSYVNDASSVVASRETSILVGSVVSSTSSLSITSFSTPTPDVASPLAEVSSVAALSSSPPSLLLGPSPSLLSQSSSLWPSPTSVVALPLIEVSSVAASTSHTSVLSSSPPSLLLGPSPSLLSQSSSLWPSPTSVVASPLTEVSSAAASTSHTSVLSSSPPSLLLGPSPSLLSQSSSLWPTPTPTPTSTHLPSVVLSQPSSSLLSSFTATSLLSSRIAISSSSTEVPSSSLVASALYSSLTHITSLPSIFSSPYLPTRTSQTPWITGIIHGSSSSSPLLKSMASKLPSSKTPHIKTFTSYLSSATSPQLQSVTTSGVSGLEMVASSTETVPVSSVNVIGDTMGGNYTTIDSFIHNITKLDFKDISSLNKSLAMMDSLLTSAKPEDYNTNNPLTATKSLEEFVFRYMDYHWNGTGFHYNRQNIVLRGDKCYPGNDSYEFRLSESDNKKSAITLPKENFVSSGTLVLSIAFKRLHDFIDDQSYKLPNDRYKLKSRIISTSMKPSRQTLANNATMVFEIISPQADSDSEKECVYWRFPLENEDAGWSRDGCIVTSTTEGHVECSCNHLTNFAILMRIDNKKLSRNEDAILTILTNLGLGFSIVGCVITFFSYWFFTEAKSEQSQIRMNLVFVLAVAHILFLLGSPAKFHLVVCVIVAVLLQLFYTSALCWMFAEGIQLYMQVVKVFNTNLKMRQIYGFAWGFPLLLITVSLSIAGNGSGGISSFVNDDFCWLSVDNHLIWTFIAPVILLIMGNLVVLGMVLKEMNRINQPIGDKHGEIPLRSSVKALIVLAPLLGVTWLMGLLCILGADVIGLYIFTILNSIQGFLIFVFHCWRNTEIQGKFRRKVQALEENRSRQEDVFHAHHYKSKTHVKKEAFTKKPTISKRPKARKQSPGGLTISNFDPSDFMDVQFNASTKL